MDCLCNVGVQECPEHPGRLLTKEQKIQARKDWDARVAESGLLDNIILLPEPTRTQRIGSDWDPENLFVFVSQAQHARHHKLGHPGLPACDCYVIRLKEVMPDA